MPIVLNGCENWYFIFRKEYSLMVFENRVLRGIFGPKREEVTREWRRLHNQELYGLYSSLNNIRVIKTRRIRWSGHVTRSGERCIQGFGVET